MEPQQVVLVVALRGNEAGITNQSADHRLVEAIGRAGCADDILLHHHRSHIVRAVVQRDLPDMRAHRHPARSDRIDIVEIQPTQRLRAQVIRGSSHAHAPAEQGMGVLIPGAIEFRHDVAGERLVKIVAFTLAPFQAPPQRRVLALERPGDERFVSSAVVRGEVGDGAILPLPHQLHVVNAIGDAFDVAEHHRGRSVHAQFVRNAHGREPFLGVAFAKPDLAAHGRGEDFPAAARYGIESGLLQSLHHPPQLRLEACARRIEKADELDEFRRAERVNMDVGEALLDRRQQIGVPAQRQLRVHAALHEDLRPADVNQFLDLVEHLVILERVGVVLIAIASKGAKSALCRANVGVVDVAVDDVGADRLAVESATDGVRPPSQLVDRHLVKQPKGLGPAETELTGRHVGHHGGVEHVELGTGGRGHERVTCDRRQRSRHHTGPRLIVDPAVGVNPDLARGFTYHTFKSSRSSRVRVVPTHGAPTWGLRHVTV